MGVTIEDLKSPDFFNIYQDLQIYTGLNDAELVKRLTRLGVYHFLEEFRYWGGSEMSERERAWYYQSNVSYLFANALHPPWATLGDVPRGAEVLDFGAGCGTDAIYLAKERKCIVTAVEPNEVQYGFIYFRTAQRGLAVHVTQCHSILVDRHERFDAIVCRDVLEHLPNYPQVLTELLGMLRVGGSLFENTPFQKAGHAEDVHLHEVVPLAGLIVGNGCERVGPYQWRKMR